MAARQVCTKVFELNNGMKMPAVGLGTWQGKAGSDDEKTMEDSIVFALQQGYRLIDTAQAYGVESVVGRAVRRSGVPRSEITVVTKFWGHWHHDPATALQRSLDALGLDYVDVFLMHFPWATTPEPDCSLLRIDQSPTFVETWKKMEPLVGKACKAIGVSNFTQKLLDELLPQASIVPAVNQVEIHALNPNFRLVPYCRAKHIHVMSWSTLGGQRQNDMQNAILTDPIFTNIAARHDCSVGVVSLSWAVQRGLTVIPKSASQTRIADNIRLIDPLSEDEMASIDNAHKVLGTYRAIDHSPNLRRQVDGKDTVMGWTAVDFGWEDEQGNWLV